ncbi:protein spire homolog 2-like isoform X2 [Rhineura floridana]|uniref:protein spire homolog 2-like isoform X2 n=1 Tax=Rhineura floridana TaxID=261503 RepID=UPI002AC81570|nr:protein spire homolog 2-like isoform X2 [Rhineura floridana]
MEQSVGSSQTLHEKILEEIKQERKLRPVESQCQNQKGFGSLPCIMNACSDGAKLTTCISLLEVSGFNIPPQRQRPRVLLKAPTLAEMEEMITSEAEDSPSPEAVQEPGPLMPLKRDRSFSEQDLAQFQSESSSSSQPDSEYLGPSGSEPRPCSGTVSPAWTSMENTGSVPASYPQALCDARSFPREHGFLSSVEEKSEAGSSTASDANLKDLRLEFSHPVESLALTVEEMINVRQVLAKAEMEKFLQSKELYSSLKKGKICCCCRTKFALFSWPPTCLFCKRSVCSSCSLKIKLPSKKLAHIPVYALGFETVPGSLGTKAPPFWRREAFQAEVADFLLGLLCVHDSVNCGMVSPMRCAWRRRCYLFGASSLQGMHWRSVEEEFPYIYVHGSVLKDVCSDCSGFVKDIVSSSRKTMDILNTTPCRSRKTQSLYIPSS